MEWMNIHIAKQLRSPACVGSSPSELGTWILCLGYCCEQENGGRITGAAKWKDRQLQRAIGVTIAEVRSSDRLLTIEGDDILVNGYPETKVANVQRLRGQSQAAALRRWGKRDGQCQEAMPQGMPYGIPQGMPKGNAEGEGEGEGEEEREGEAAAAPPSASMPPQPPHDPMDQALQAVEESRPKRRSPIPPAGFAEWRIMVGKRVFVGPDERPEWLAMFEAEGWDEMTRGYEYLAKKYHDPAKIFLSMFQELR